MLEPPGSIEGAVLIASAPARTRSAAQCLGCLFEPESDQALGKLSLRQAARMPLEGWREIILQ